MGFGDRYSHFQKIDWLIKCCLLGLLVGECRQVKKAEIYHAGGKSAASVAQRSWLSWSVKTCRQIRERCLSKESEPMTALVNTALNMANVQSIS